MKWGLSAIILPCTATIPGQAYGSTDIFAPASRLASGKWVKIGISESGIYEIPHEKLRELGFSTPGNVAVFGHGGKAQDEQFLSQTGKVLFDDDLTPVLHHRKCGLRKLHSYVTAARQSFRHHDKSYNGDRLRVP